MTIQAVSETSKTSALGLDALIDTFLQMEYDLKLAILNDETEAVEALDGTIRNIETQIRSFECQSSHDRKRLGTFLIDHYLANDENARLVPSGVAKKLKELIG